MTYFMLIDYGGGSGLVLLEFVTEEDMKKGFLTFHNRGRIVKIIRGEELVAKFTEVSFEPVAKPEDA